MARQQPHRGVTASPPHYRMAVASRVLAAVVGGYGAASLLGAVLAAALPLVSTASRADGVLFATLLTFVFYTAAMVWAFSTRSATRAWLGLAAVCGVCGLLVAVLPRPG